MMKKTKKKTSKCKKMLKNNKLKIRTYKNGRLDINYINKKYEREINKKFKKDPKLLFAHLKMMSEIAKECTITDNNDKDKVDEFIKLFN